MRRQELSALMAGRVPVWAVVCLLLAVAPVDCFAKRKNQSPKLGVHEPFDSFRMLDANLSLLDRQLDVTKKIIDRVSTGAVATQTGSRQPSPWLEQARSVNRTADSIGRITVRLQKNYTVRRQPFGIRVFRSLNARANDIRRAAQMFAATRNAGDAVLALEKLSQARLNFIVGFQAISGGYGAVHCNRGAWTCCVPKDTKERNDGIREACSWTCVSKARACKRGFLGPRSAAPR